MLAALTAGNRWGQPRMRPPPSETLEVIRLIEESHLSVRLTLLGVSETLCIALCPYG